MIAISKQHSATSHFAPLEKASVTVDDANAASLKVCDAEGRAYVSRSIKAGRKANFQVRGTAGRHHVLVHNADGHVIAKHVIRLAPQTQIVCAKGPYGKLADRLANLMTVVSRKRPFVVDGKLYNFFVSWGRDHTHVMKAMKYFERDVKSGIEFFLERQQPNGMFWDDCHANIMWPMPNWFCEALGKGYYSYSNDMKYTIRRIPVEADVEFLYTECVWYVWKATGDDAWMAEQLPKLEKALEYNSSHPTRWSEKHGLVRRSFCMDSWDFANPHYCKGDHRCINPGDPQFLFHSDNSGLYASHWRIAEMHAALGNTQRAQEVRSHGEALRRRANKKLFFETNYGHMIPEDLPARQVYALVGDERERMSLSTGYTINRGLPTHAMAVKILDEYQRRGKKLKKESFAEWWTMDPMYDDSQWPGVNRTSYRQGEYMNGAICTIVAGELSRAAFEHGREAYGADIIERVWQLSERDGGELHQVYKRLPDPPPDPPKAIFSFVDLSTLANVGLRHGAHKGVTAWTGEGANDMRNLPVGHLTSGAVEFDIIDPAANDGKAVVRLDPKGVKGPQRVTVPIDGVTGRSIYFMHALAHSANGVAGAYDVCYADGTEARIYMRSGHEFHNWWGCTDNPDTRRHRNPVDRNVARVAWRGANGQWKTVGLYMTGWNNPHPDVPITAIRCEAITPEKGAGGIMLAAVSISDRPVCFETSIRSGGLPDTWSQAAVYYAIAEGLAGIEDKGRAFDEVTVSPRWAVSQSDRNEVTLHYPASDGYCSYTYKLDRKQRRITIDLTGSFHTGLLHCLMPGKSGAKKVTINGRETPFKTVKIEQSVYTDVQLDELPLGPMRIEY